MATKLLLSWIGLSVGNFIYAWADQQGTEHAFERSFFQGVAFLMAWIITRTERAS